MLAVMLPILRHFLSIPFRLPSLRRRLRYYAFSRYAIISPRVRALPPVTPRHFFAAAFHAVACRQPLLIAMPL